MPLTGVQYKASFIRELNVPLDSSNEAHYMGLTFRKYQEREPYFQIKQLYFNHNKIQFYENPEPESLVLSSHYSNISQITLSPPPVGAATPSLRLDENLFRLENGEDLDFTLFTSKLIDAITKYSEYVTVSGKAVEYGYMAYGRPDFTYAPYPGLKMEGDMINVSLVLESVNALRGMDRSHINEGLAAVSALMTLLELDFEEVVELLETANPAVPIPVMDIGNDCPPVWETTLQSIIQGITEKQNQIKRRVRKKMKKNKLGKLKKNNTVFWDFYLHLVRLAWYKFALEKK